jgi:UDP-N-acetylglucosamine 4,6-dehydratase
MKGKRILILGATGSLGISLTSKYIKDNQIMNISRNEEKQWNLRTLIKSENLRQVIGDVTYYNEVRSSVYLFDPHVILYVCALKHIDICEKQPVKTFQINVNGVDNIVNDIINNRVSYRSLETFLFVSTDKACLPITIYGYSKSTSEKIIQNTVVPGIKFVAVRYGNVLNSSGSILPLLHSIGKSSDYPHFSLTDIHMTRFIMRLEESVDLIEYAIEHGKNNEIIIPKLRAFCISDLIDVFSEIYKKDIVITGLRCIEKINEDLVSKYEADCAYNGIIDKYIHITSEYQSSGISPLSSNHVVITKDELMKYLNLYDYI